MLNKDIVLRRAAEAAAGTVTQQAAKSFLEGTSFFPRKKQEPAAQQVSQPEIPNNQPAQAASANGVNKKWDDLLPQTIGEVWVRKKETPAQPPAEKNANKKLPEVQPVQPVKLPTAGKPQAQPEVPPLPAAAKPVGDGKA